MTLTGGGAWTRTPASRRRNPIGSPVAAASASSSTGGGWRRANAAIDSYQSSSHSSTYASPGRSRISGCPPNACGARAASVTCSTTCPRTFDPVTSASRDSIEYAHARRRARGGRGPVRRRPSAARARTRGRPPATDVGVRRARERVGGGRVQVPPRRVDAERADRHAAPARAAQRVALDPRAREAALDVEDQAVAQRVRDRDARAVRPRHDVRPRGASQRAPPDP